MTPRGLRPGVFFVLFRWKTVYKIEEVQYNVLIKRDRVPFCTLLFSEQELPMTKLLVVFAAALVLAYFSEQNTRAAAAAGCPYVPWKDWAYVALVVVLTLFAGLRTSYNDTANYIHMFQGSLGVVGHFSDPENRDILGNPLFYLFANIIKDTTDNAQVMIFLSAAFSQICFILFLKRYCSNFVFGVFLYFTLGTFLLSMAAIKQTMAMAVLTLAIPYLEKKQWLRYCLIVFLAMLIHTYAIAFAVLPLFVRRPWRLFTYTFAFVTFVLLMNFQDVVTSFLEQADEMGKTIAEYEVFDNVSVNIFRIAVYAVPPLCSLVFQQWIFQDASKMKYVLVHMSVISLACMIMGTQSGANMFGRMANYFEFGAICTLPWMLEQTFDKRSNRLITAIATVGFLGFFVYANMIAVDFDQIYNSISLFRFIASLF